MCCLKQSRFYHARNAVSKQGQRGKACIVIIAALATLAGCAPLAEVRTTSPRLGTQYGTSAQLQRAEQQIAAGQQLRASHPHEAVGCYLASIESTTSELHKNPRDRTALRDYNFALSRVFSATRDAHLDPWARPLQIPVPNGVEYWLSKRLPANRLWKPQDFDLIPADELDVH